MAAPVAQAGLAWRVSDCVYGVSSGHCRGVLLWTSWLDTGPQGSEQVSPTNQVSCSQKEGQHKVKNKERKVAIAQPVSQLFCEWHDMTRLIPIA